MPTPPMPLSAASMPAPSRHGGLPERMPAVAPAAIARRYPSTSPTTGQCRPKCRPTPIAAPTTRPFTNPIPRRLSMTASCASAPRAATGVHETSHVGDRDDLALRALDAQHDDDVQRLAQERACRRRLHLTAEARQHLEVPQRVLEARRVHA